MIIERMNEDPLCNYEINLKIEDIKYWECNPNTNSKLSFYDEEFFEVTFAVEGPNNYRQVAKDEIEKVLS